MEIKTISSFLSYYERIREVTNRIVQVIPQDKLDWSYMPGKFTIADLVRHIAAIERNLFAETVLGNPICYLGCGKELTDGYENIVNYYNEMHEQSLAIFKTISDEDLLKTINSANGKTTTIGSFLRSLIIHEVHHRGTLCIYLNLINVKTPPILALTEEDVIQISKSFKL